ncbi:hypothetical protein HLB44_32550 [Aquincola sp. S2]|uniref:Uncharacterized protein n=1 Tax=Pseudaquabacterium terrae TaxID=2732868 RepID=A0ABX2ET58_9BURK|nr:hypothetical protein [Aquabacterium terrae]NRF71729.1 hypothetical protein [Aquabacterium terrae]
MKKEFRVYYGSKLATKAQLDAIEEIVVEQEIGHSWAARIRIPVCIGEDGSWHGENEPAYADHARVRVEARIGDGDFIALIDGSIHSQEPDYNATPGRSAVTLVVHDDTRLLHREAASESFSGQTDSEIVTAIFQAAALGEEPDVEDTPRGADANAVVNRRGTMMEMLRLIAARYGDFHAYVLPGSSVGTSKGCFKKLRTGTGTALPQAILSGPQRNLSEFRIQRNAGRAARFEGAHLSLGDLSVTTASASPGDALAAGATGATESDDEDLLVRRLPPGTGDQTDLDEAARGMAAESGYTLRADGSVIPSIYPAILSPYRVLPVRLSNSRYSTDYVVYKVTHTLGISEYTQRFSVIGNQASPEAGAGASLPAAAAAPGLNFNVQVGIF